MPWPFSWLLSLFLPREPKLFDQLDEHEQRNEIVRALYKHGTAPVELLVAEFAADGSLIQRRLDELFTSGVVKTHRKFDKDSYGLAIDLAI